MLEFLSLIGILFLICGAIQLLTFAITVSAGFVLKLRPYVKGFRTLAAIGNLLVVYTVVSLIALLVLRSSAKDQATGQFILSSIIGGLAVLGIVIGGIMNKVRNGSYEEERAHHQALNDTITSVMGPDEGFAYQRPTHSRMMTTDAIIAVLSIPIFVTGLVAPIIISNPVSLRLLSLAESLSQWSLVGWALNIIGLLLE